MLADDWATDRVGHLQSRKCICLLVDRTLEADHKALLRSRMWHSRDWSADRLDWDFHSGMEAATA